MLLFLRDHAAALSQQNPPPLGQLAQEWFGKRSGYPAPPQGWFERKLQRGQVLVLLDGLDEVAEEGVRKNVSRWVDEQIQRYPRSRFVVTARPHGYRGAPLARASVLELQLLSQEQVRRFVEGWYLANEIMAAGGKEDRGVRQEAARNLMVVTGQVIEPTVGPTRTEEDFCEHVKKTVATDPKAGWVIVVDNLNTHCSESLVRWVAALEGIRTWGARAKTASCTTCRAAAPSCLIRLIA